MKNKISKRNISEEIFRHLEVQLGRKLKDNVPQLGNLRIYEMTQSANLCFLFPQQILSSFDSLKVLVGIEVLMGGGWIFDCFYGEIVMPGEFKGILAEVLFLSSLVLLELLFLSSKNLLLVLQYIVLSFQLDFIVFELGDLLLQILEIFICNLYCLQFALFFIFSLIVLHFDVLGLLLGQKILEMINSRFLLFHKYLQILILISQGDALFEQLDISSFGKPRFLQLRIRLIIIQQFFKIDSGCTFGVLLAGCVGINIFVFVGRGLEQSLGPLLQLFQIIPTHQQNTITQI